MRSSLVGLAGLIDAAGIPPDAFAQEWSRRARNQSLREQVKLVDLFRTQSLKPTVADPPARPNRASDGTKSQRPTIIQGPRATTKASPLRPGSGGVTSRECDLEIGP